jgi:hypothetical protein
MLYNLIVPRGNGTIYNLFVETTKKYELEELKQKLYDANINEDLKDDISFVTKYTIENPQVKFFLIKHGAKVIELKEVRI